MAKTEEEIDKVGETLYAMILELCESGVDVSYFPQEAHKVVVKYAKKFKLEKEVVE